MPRNILIQIRRGTSAEWAEANPVLAVAEPGLEIDTNKVKYGDGSAHWNDLPYAGGTLNIIDVINLQNQLDSKAPINNPTFTGTVGGITKNMVGLGNVDNTSDINKPISTAVQTALDLKSNVGHNHNISDVNGLQSALDGKQAAGSYATLANGLIPAIQLPSYVDDVLESANLAALPSTGETGKIYVTLDSNKTYRWSGSSYIEISASPGSTDAVPEGSVNKYYTDARASAAAPVQSVAGKTGTVTLSKSDVGLGNVDNTSDASKPISTAVQTALNAKAPINNPVFTGVVTALNINKVTITQPTNGSILTISDGKTFAVANTVSINSSDNANVFFGSGGNVLYASSVVDGGSF